MPASRLFAAIASLILVALPVSAQDAPPVMPQANVKLKGQENLSKTEREKLNRQLAKLKATRAAEKKADLADMHAQRAASDFALLKGDFETYPSGLLYRDVVVGEGPEVRWGDSVETHYTTWYFDGRKLDSSRDREGSFPVINVGKARVLEAWNEGLLGMREGGKRILIAPSDLAYGKFDSAVGVPGGTHLAFEIEVLAVDPVPLRPNLAKLKLSKTDSGLQWADLIVGKGDRIDPGDTAMIKYSGWLVDRPEAQAFDSSFQIRRAYPVADIGNATVLAGWNEGLIGMRAGGRRVLLVPPKLGYGAEGLKDLVPADATLLYLMEVVSVFPQRPKVAALKLTTNESGLKWATLKKGKGRQTQAGDEVEVHFTGWRPDGKVFDSSHFGGLAFTVPEVGAGLVIAGFDEGMVGMRAGEKRVLVVPPALGYGSEGAGQAVPPDAELIVLIELVATRPPPAPIQVSN